MRHVVRGLLVAAAVTLPSAVRAHELISPPPARGAAAPQTADAAGDAARARALASAGKHREALAILDGVIARIGDADRRARADAEILRATSLRASAQLDTAAAAASRALTDADAIGDAGLRVRARLTVARIAQDRSDIERFKALHDEAMRIAEAAGDPRLQLSVLSGLATYARQTGRQAEALAFQTREVEAADKTGERGLSVRARTGRSTTLLGLGRYDEALADSEKAHELAQAGGASLEASAAFSLAQVHAHIWNLDAAADLWDEAIAHYREAGLQIGVALSLRQYMDTLLALGDLDRAAQAGAEALALFERTGSGGTLPDTLARLALIEARRGNTAAASTYAAQARAALATVVARRRVFIENDLGLVSLFAGDAVAALHAFRTVRAMAREHGDIEYEWRGEYGLGRASLTAGDAPAAHHHLQRAAVIVERMRLALPDPGQRASFMTQRAMVHEALVDALMARSTGPADWYARRAFDVAEAARARALADQLAEARVRSSDPAMIALKTAEAEIAARLAALQKPGGAEQREDAEREYDSLVARIRREHRRYATLAWPEPATADSLAATIAHDEAVVSFLTGDQTGWGWALRDGRLAAFRLPSRPELDALVRDARAAAARDDAATRQIAVRLYDTLIAPAREIIGNARRLIVIPDGPLHRLPFAMLRDGNQWLVQTHAIGVAPSATVLAELRRRESNARRRALAFAAPSGDGGNALPNAAGEAREAARLMGGWSAARVPASEADAKNDVIGRYRLLHFAAHARVDERLPRHSAIVLDRAEAEDGLLEAGEIAHLPLDADLVVLAACRSHMGRAVRGEGFLNLTRAFMQAGARAVVASVWDVNDGDSRRLMQAFYTRIARGAEPDVALREAQIAMIGTSPPAAWAGMIVTGDAARPVEGMRWSPASAGAGLAGLILLGASAWRVSARRRARRLPASIG